MPFEMVRNDITRMNVDAIVNAANTSLLGGGGVDGAIHRAAGPELLAECRTLGGCPAGEAKITKGYRLPARYVIHTVGPIWQGGQQGERELLRACYRNSLALATEYGCESVAFPLISAGAYGYPKDEAISVAVDEIRRFLDGHEMTVYLVLFGPAEFKTGSSLFHKVREYIDDVYAETHLDRRNSLSREALWRESQDEALLLEHQLAAEDACIMAPSAPEPERKKTPARKSLFRRDKGAAPSKERETALESARPSSDTAGVLPPVKVSGAAPNWEELLKRTDEGFSASLMRLIDERGMTDAQCYKRANVDRKLFSKIRSNPDYKPSKPTVFAFAVALRLSLPETRDLLRRAGFALSHSSKFDIILEYFIMNRLYDIFEINEVLFQFDMPLLGSAVN